MFKLNDFFCIIFNPGPKSQARHRKFRMYTMVTDEGDAAGKSEAITLHLNSH